MKFHQIFGRTSAAMGRAPLAIQDLGSDAKFDDGIFYSIADRARIFTTRRV